MKSNGKKKYDIKVPHFYCLEYHENDKRLIVEMDFREEYFYLEPELITHWENPYENIPINMDEKRRILTNIREFLLTKTIPSHIITRDESLLREWNISNMVKTKDF